jgi:hypothetical protein
MVNPQTTGCLERRAPRLGARTVAIAAVFLAVCASIATWPRVLTLRWALPDQYDALQHLWIMRWYKTCFLERRLVFRCPEIQFPIGAPLGNFSALHLQALFYFPLSLVIDNDVICYNILWVFGLLATGLGTFVLAWYLVRDGACAAFGGMLAMLSAPMLIHAHSHLELIYVGGFPLFLVAWMRFLDRPGWWRLVLAAAGYVVVAMSAAYFMVFAIFPAVLYAAWLAGRNGARGVGPWVRERGPWLAGFAVLALPVLAVLFSSQFWAIAHGHSLNWPPQEFARYGAPLWSYVVPTHLHLLGSLLPSNPYPALGESGGERTAYLGVVTMAILAYGALHRVRFRGAAYLWATFGLLVVLSLGASCQVAGRTISLPSAWVWNVFPPYRMTRVPARLSLFAGVVAGALAAGGLKHLLARFPGRSWRVAVLGGLSAAAVADLAMVPFWMSPIPAMPGCYAFLKRHDPGATIAEIPHLGTGGSELNAACTYWQSLHRLSTSAGYSGHPNVVEDARMGFNSPFLAGRLAQPDYLDVPGKMNFDVVTHVDFSDYVWLYLTVNRFDYIVLHQRPGAVPECPVRLDRLKELLKESKVYEDEATVVYARARLTPPKRPVAICREEWRDRHLWQGRWNCLVPKTARIVVYNPEPGRDLTLTLDTASAYRTQEVRVEAGGAALARWEATPPQYSHSVTPPFRLPAGLNELTLHAEGADPGIETRASRHPYRLRVARVGLSDTPEAEDLTILARDPNRQDQSRRE